MIIQTNGDKPYGLYIKASDPMIPDSIHVHEYRQYMNDLLQISGLMEKLNRQDVVDTIIKMETKRNQLGHTVIRSYYIKISITKAKQRWPLLFGAFWKGLESNRRSIYLYLNKSEFDTLEEWIETLSLQDLKLYVVYSVVTSRILWYGSDFDNL